jgi:uncharacterized protein (DUF433 family)/DNA-binding transcriptional MerR regulator
VTYSAAVASVLSGATVRQLSYWRSARSAEGPLLAPEHHSPRTRVSYSFRDVVALRTFVYLRSQDVSLQRVRKAVRSLREMGEQEHLSEYRLVSMGKEVVWQLSQTVAIDLTGRPAHQIIAEMLDIFGLFRARDGDEVLPLLRPVPGVAVDPEVRGGYPVVEGTRVPYDVVAALVGDGLGPEEIRGLYPSVRPADVRGALEFARYVDRRRPAAAA